MHKIGENFLYSSNGVMTVVDIREEAVGNQPRSYYVMRSVIGNSDSLFFVPTDNEKLTSAMYPLLTRENITELLDLPIDSSAIEWNDNSRARTEYFKRIMESGDRTAIMAMIRVIYESGLRRTKIGKKNFLSDEGIRHKAEKMLAVEFSIVLGITEDEALDKIRAKIEE